MLFRPVVPVFAVELPPLEPGAILHPLASYLLLALAAHLLLHRVQLELAPPLALTPIRVPSHAMRDIISPLVQSPVPAAALERGPLLQLYARILMNVAVVHVCMGHAPMEPISSHVLAMPVGLELHATHAPLIMLELIVK
jgi:hypothetical protein